MVMLGSQTSAYLILFLQALSFIKQSTADYDSELCKKYSQNGKATSDTPYFYDDFYAATEITTYARDGTTQGRVVQRDIRYSASHNQMDVEEKKMGDQMYYHVDVGSQACIYYDWSNKKCETTLYTCSKVQDQEKDYLEMSGNTIVLNQNAKKLWWPTDQEKQKSIVKMSEKSAVRNVQTVKYVTCAYDSKTDITTAAEWQVLDLDSYTNMDKTKNIVLMAKFHQSNDNVTMESQRIDFFIYRALSPEQLQYGLQISENFCRDTVYEIPGKVPYFPRRFSFTREVDQKLGKSSELITRYDQYVEYNAMSQIIKVKNYQETNDENEKEVSFTYTDYSAKHTYFVSDTTGNCSVVTGQEDLEDMPSEKRFWNLETPEPSFLREYRDIPCVALHSWNPAKLMSSYVMVATSDWLKDQGRDENEFYPVRTEYYASGKGNSEANIFEFKQNPGYHYPYLRRCFDQDTNIDASFVLRVNYEQNVKKDRITFDYELRTLLKKITGIKASMRLNNFHFSQVKEYTRAYFTIFGDARGMNRTTNKMYYEFDPVTSQEAANKIKKAVDVGDVAFVLEHENMDISFEKGSFEQFTYGISEQNASTSGHSKGTMAGVGIAMIVLGLVLGVGVLFGYKKYAQGNLPALSFSFDNKASNS